MKKRLIFLLLVLIGLTLLFLGYNESSSTVSKISKTVTGSYSDKVMFYYIAGGIATVLGGFGLSRKI